MNTSLEILEAYLAAILRDENAANGFIKWAKDRGYVNTLNETLKELLDRALDYNNEELLKLLSWEDINPILTPLRDYTNVSRQQTPPFVSSPLDQEEAVKTSSPVDSNSVDDPIIGRSIETP
jgi:hypothetical protein